jgi:hypothetical protein
MAVFPSTSVTRVSSAALDRSRDRSRGIGERIGSGRGFQPPSAGKVFKDRVRVGDPVGGGENERTVVVYIEAGARHLAQGVILVKSWGKTRAGRLVQMARREVVEILLHIVGLAGNRESRAFRVDWTSKPVGNDLLPARRTGGTGKDLGSAAPIGGGVEVSVVLGNDSRAIDMIELPIQKGIFRTGA